MRIPPARFLFFVVLLSPVLLIGFTASAVAWVADRVSTWCQRIWLEAWEGK